jgi:hypothetical protein
MKMKSIDLGTSKLAAVAVLVVVAAGVGTFVLARGGQGEQWQQHEESSFSLEAPRSWSIAETAGRITLEGESSETVVIWPFFVPGELVEESAQFVALRLASKAVPGVTWTETSTPRRGVLRLAGDSPNARVVVMLLYSGSRAGTAGSLYVTAAPEAEFDRTASTFARLLDSFEARGAPVAKRRAPSFESWTDPIEGAFSVKVPSGWSTTGGTERPSSLLVQATVSTTSADSQITALTTDELPLYVEPSPVLEFGGINEGGTYVDPSGYSSPVRGYAPGAQYVTDYVLPGHVPEAKVIRFQDQPTLARQLATYGINSYDVGEVEYRFKRNGVPYTGGALCITERISIGGYAGWHVWRLFLVEAPSERYGEGLAALRRLAGSFQIDPGWAARQAETTRQQSGIITQMSNDIGDTLSRGYWARQQVYDALAERRSRATLEVEDLTDENGNSFRVDSGSNYYWIDPSGTIVGTDTHTQPDVDFRELVGVGG